MWINNGREVTATEVIIECLDRRPLGMVAEAGPHSGGIYHAAIT